VGSSRPRPGGTRASLAARAAAAALLACALASRPAGPAPGVEGPAWPAPPERPRIRWIESVASDRGAGARRSWLERIRVTVTGESPRRLEKPLAVCPLPEGGFLVSDPGVGAVYEAPARGGKLRVFASGGRLATPVGIARTKTGEIWVADADRGVIVRYGPRGEWRGEVGGGLLVRPTGIACDAAGERVYVADAHAHRISVFDAAGAHLADLGRRGTGPGEFNFPTDVKVTPAGEIVVCDALNCRIQRLRPDGTPLAAFGRAGDARGDFGRPKGVAVDRDGNVYVVDTLYDVMQIFDAGGRLLLVVGGAGAGAGRFNLPAGVAIGADQRVYVADTANGRVQVFQYLAAAGEPR
jgi:DNA-binding beta-propeller fold protein YncE